MFNSDFGLADVLEFSVDRLAPGYTDNYVAQDRMVMLDQLVRSTLTHLPEIPSAQHKERVAAGERRHRDWQGQVADLLRQMRSEAAKERPVVSGNGAHA